jgi:hypothetical protein
VGRRGVAELSGTWAVGAEEAAGVAGDQTIILSFVIFADEVICKAATKFGGGTTT